MNDTTNTSDQLTAIDLFCGAGGFSEGLRQASEELGLELHEAAVNHWETAIETHESNHPDAHQYHSKVEQLHPPNVATELADGDDMPDVDLLVGGPSCTHFSRARGGKPVNEQLRMSPWHVLNWLEHLCPDAFVIENVPEIQDWGPVDDEGQPTRDGSIFDAWVNALNQLGYSVDWTELTAADYGDPTTRERFFIVGRRSGSVTFPEPTHGPHEALPDHRTAAEIIDWSDLGTSIFTRDLTEPRVTSPPKDTTMQRIAEGLRKHCAPALEPFADALAELGKPEIRALRERPIPPASHAGAFAAELDEPFLVRVPDAGQRTATHLLRQQDGGKPYDVDTQPVPTIAKRGGHAIYTAETRSLVMPKNGVRGGLHSNALYEPETRPFHTVTSDPRAKLVTPSLVRYSHGGAALAVDEPMPTIATEKGGVFALANPYLCPLYNERAGQRPRTRSIDRPTMTVPSSKSPAALSTPLVRPFIEDCQGPAKRVTRPLPTQPASDRFALCVPEMFPWGLDIRYRMLQPSELKQAQGFPEDYQIAGTKTDRTEQIGNAVPVQLAKALCKHVLTAADPDLGSFGGGIERDQDADIPSYHEVASDD